MELDKLKNTWEKVSEIDAKPNDEQILKLLKSSNKSIWNGIVKREKISFILATIFSILFCWLLQEGGNKVSLILITYFVVLPIWQLFKWVYFRKIDVMNSDILSILKYANKYRNFCIYEWVIMIIWIILLLVLLPMKSSSDFSILLKYLMIGGFILVTGALAIFTTRYRYQTTIGKIKRNLEEMKAFEKEE